MTRREVAGKKWPRLITVFSLDLDLVQHRAARLWTVATDDHRPPEAGQEQNWCATPHSRPHSLEQTRLLILGRGP
jgi:hypothetical protein